MCGGTNFARRMLEFILASSDARKLTCLGKKQVPVERDTFHKMNEFPPISTLCFVSEHSEEAFSCTVESMPRQQLLKFVATVSGRQD